MCNKSEQIIIFPVTCAESVNLTTPWAEYSGTYHKTDQVNCILNIWQLGNMYDSLTGGKRTRCVEVW